LTTYSLGMILEPPSTEPDLATFAVTKIPAPPIVVAPPRIPDWQMACNDRLGDCAEAKIVHADMTWASILGQPYTYPGDAAVQSAYFAQTNGQDTGLVLSTELARWKSGGNLGSRIIDYKPVHPKNTKLVKQAIWIFGCLDTGVALPAPAQQQFKPDGSGVWELTHTEADYQIEGGHDVLAVGYTQRGPVAVTWGGLVQITWEWWYTYVQQNYAIVPQQFAQFGGDGRGFKLPAVEQYLAAA
jgi:hypothetical protein